MYLSAAPVQYQPSPRPSLTGELDSKEYVQPHYREAYRLAIYALVSGGKEAYYDVLKTEQISNFLSEQELFYILEKVQQPATSDLDNENSAVVDETCSTGTYWPEESDSQAPALDLGWPEDKSENMATNIDLLFHPPRLNFPSIKEVIRKKIQEAKQVLSIVMDIFTDVDIFKEIVEASLRGIAVYVLLDDSHINAFFSMAEQQNVEIQKLTNMRVRAVKGLGYLCRSGAKFHGAMDQRFMLVDSKTVVFGSYSFMWSYEKINLSMVQIITGPLVRAFDEEFRIMFARSTVPTMEKMPQDDKHNRISSVGRSAIESYGRYCSSTSSLELEFKLQHKYQDNRPSLKRSNNLLNLFNPPLGLEASGFMKGHGGESLETWSSKMNSETSGNLTSDGNSRVLLRKKKYLCKRMGDSLQAGTRTQLYKSDRTNRQSFHGTDKQVLSLQQTLPSWEKTTKAFLRMYRIESYLRNADLHTGNTSANPELASTWDDGIESWSNQNSLSSQRSSLELKSSISDHLLANSSNNSQSSTVQDDQCNLLSTRRLYQSVQWSPVRSVESRMRRQDLVLKSHSFHSLREPKIRRNSGLVRDAHQSSFSTLDRARWRQSDIYKKYTSAETDPRRQSNVSQESLHRHMSSPLVSGETEEAQTKRTTSEIPQENNLRESQRSVSHSDLCKMAERKNPSTRNWQELPTRAVSTATLLEEIKESVQKSSSFESPFFKNGPNKFTTLYDISEASEISTPIESGSGLTADHSTVVQDSNSSSSKEATSATSRPTANVSSLYKENHLTDKTKGSSAIHLSTGQLQYQSASFVQKQRQNSLQEERLYIPTKGWHRNPSGENRVYSRFETFHSLEGKRSDQSMPFTAVTSEGNRHRTLLSHNPGSSNENYSSIMYRTHPRSDNKFGKFMQRVGNLIHKSDRYKNFMDIKSILTSKCPTSA